MKISVVIPFYNEEKTLLKTLHAIDHQTHKAHEIIFVDSGSTDDSKKIITEYSNSHPESNVIILFSGEMSPSSSINLGIKSAKSELIAYTDCDLDIPKNWLQSNYDLIIKENSKIVSVKFYTCGKGIIDKSFIAQTYGYKSYSYPLTGSLMYRSLLKKIGYLLPNVRANYDVDFVAKLQKYGIQRCINPDVVVRYFGTNYCSSFRSGILKIARYSEGAWKVKSDKKPFIYILSSILLITSIYLNITLLFITLYLLIRGFIMPIYKSSPKLLSDIPLLLTLPLTGIVIDGSRLIGYLYILKLMNNSKYRYDW